MIGKYCYVAQNHNDSLVGANGFRFRRIYFTYKNHLDEEIDVKFRFEMASSGDFNTKSKLAPAVKDAFIAFKEDFGKITFGIQSPPTFAKVEGLWGYRSLEKTPLDLQGWASSRDFGISFAGKQSILSYTLMLGNSSGNKSETDKGKRLYASVGITPIEGFYIEFYGDYNGIDASSKDYIAQGFVSYKTSPFRIGLLYSRKGTLGDTNAYNIISGYGVYSVNEGLDVILRYDKMLDGGGKGEGISYIPFATNTPSNFVLAGLSYSINKKVKVMPNIEYVFYDTTGVSSDLYPRLTLYYKF